MLHQGRMLIQGSVDALLLETSMRTVKDAFNRLTHGDDE